MLPQNGVKVVLGTATIGDASDPVVGFSTLKDAQDFLNVFHAHGGDEIDSARGYPPHAPGTSEPIVGQTDVAQWAHISTKVQSAPGDHSTAGIEKSVNESLQALQVPRLYIDFLHHPDPNTPLEETIAAMDAAHRAGKFQHFGISNYSIEQVREILAICEKMGYNKPTVYQGQYNAVARVAENELLPLLRENGIKFYAWSPAAGGAFSGNSARLSGGSYMLAQLWQNAYGKSQVKSALEQIHERAEKAGISGHAVALRWALHHSALKGEHGDAIVIGARTLKQIESSMEMCSAGPLPQDLVDLIQDTWEVIKDTAPGFTPSFE